MQATASSTPFQSSDTHYFTLFCMSRMNNEDSGTSKQSPTHCRHQEHKHAGGKEARKGAKDRGRGGNQRSLSPCGRAARGPWGRPGRGVRGSRGRGRGRRLDCAGSYWLSCRGCRAALCAPPLRRWLSPGATASSRPGSSASGPLHCCARCRCPRRCQTGGRRYEIYRYIKNINTRK